MSIEAMKQALEALEKLWDIIDDIDTYGDMAKSDDKLYRSLVERRQRQRFEQTGISTDGYELNGGVITSLRQAIAEAEKQEPKRLWLWKNFVDGRPEYWAFDNPYPCVSARGDSLTLGEPCGWAFLKPSVNGRPDRSEQEVINTVTRLAAHSIKENT